ncbi:MAG: formyltransferase family protein [Patescibacteria group bacterium]|nr:formyltransferase family protein [Patescibacteria group bacterium]
MTKVTTVLIASGSGTDANAIMEAYRKGFIPEISLKKLISTKKGAGCLERAKRFRIETLVVDREYLGGYGFNKVLFSELQNVGCELIFLVGCVVKIPTMLDVSIYNIHPADIEKFGGKGMYGLAVHEKVLSEVLDLISRGKKSPDDRFFTYPTVHEAVSEYDSGAPLLVGSVEIPRSIIKDLLVGRIDLQSAAQRLQDVVLPYEWMMLPTAVKIAANKILANTPVGG